MANKRINAQDAIDNSESLTSRLLYLFATFSTVIGAIYLYISLT